MSPETTQGYRIAFALAIFTILYNIAEGIVSMYFGISDESLALFGFGADSFIEVISGLGIAGMIIRIRKNEQVNRSGFEKTALKITGTAFYLLVAGLILTAGYNLFTSHKPETTFWGVMISVVSIIVMLVLLKVKLKTGKALKSDAIVADAHCTRVCIYMSVVLLLSSLLYELTGLAWIDILGTLGLAWFSYTEGRECFEKARSEKLCGCSYEKCDP